MVKPDLNRDYYADLGISSSADVADIKKQFRKLALQYHPDRNPGREAEVNSKFQIIQSAHEILSDPEAKAKYDANRRSRYPTASGVRGNPWQDVGKDFPAPPRRAGAERSSRNPPPPPPPSGAQKYRNFTSGTAPTAKQPSREDPEARRNAWQAFESMRPSSQGKSAASQAKRPVPPRPTESASTRPVPRTPGQKQKAEAAFGARKSGYAPHSPVPGDEPSASSSGYATNRHTYDASSANTRDPIPDPLAQFRDKYGDSRQSTPYHSGGGEKMDPFDGVPLSRAKSTRERESPRNDQQANGDTLSPGGNRHRSSSAPRSATPNEANGGSEIPQRHPFTSRASARYTPAGVTPNTSGPGTPTGLNGADQAHPTSANAGQAEGPSMYAYPISSRRTSFSFKPSFDPASSRATTYGYPYGNGTASNAMGGLPREKSPSSPPPSGGNSFPGHSLTSYERCQQEMLKSLISSAYSPTVLKKKREISRSSSASLGQDANKNATRSFSFAVDDDTFSPASSGPNRFARGSADDINTRFVNNQSPEPWQFTAGSPREEGQDPLKKRRAPTGNGTGRESPQEAPPRPPKEYADNSRVPPAVPKTTWDAQGWESIGAENFAPQPAPPASASPTRQPTRSHSRKPKVKATAGSAGLVNEESGSDENREFIPPRPHAEVPISDSPTAMDIDSPPSKPSPAPQQPPTARNIHVEPSRPEWRPGNVQSVPEIPVPNPMPKPAFNPNAAGSEDSEEFRASLADLRNVAPFANKPSGLNSFGDLKSNLPFESRAASGVNLDQGRKKAQQLNFPVVPRAPNPPPALAVPNLKPSTAAWQKYVQEFQEYMQRWDDFNAKVTDHFDARKHQVQDARKAKGYAFLATHGTEGIQEYLEWVQQDRDIRRQWAAACEDHEQRVKSFLAHRVQMR